MKRSKTSKLKPFRTPGLLILGIYLVLFGMIFYFGERGVVFIEYIIAPLLLCLSLLLFGSFIKTRNYLVLLFGFLLFPKVTLIKLILNIHKIPDQIAGFSESIHFILFLIGLNMMKKRFPKGAIWSRYFRDLLEFSAISIKGNADGFTSRPFPVKKSDYSKTEIIQFSKYLNKKMISTSYTDEDRVILVFSNGFFQYIPFLKPDLQKETYVSFDFEGNISVHVAKADYDNYKEELTFDQLCKSFGDVIFELFSAFKRDEPENMLKKIRGSDRSKSFWYFEPLFSKRREKINE